MKDEIASTAQQQLISSLIADLTNVIVLRIELFGVQGGCFFLCFMSILRRCVVALLLLGLTILRRLILLDNFFLALCTFVFIFQSLQQILVETNGVFGIRLASRTSLGCKGIPLSRPFQGLLEFSSSFLHGTTQIRQDGLRHIVPHLRPGCLTEVAGTLRPGSRRRHVLLSRVACNVETGLCARVSAIYFVLYWNVPCSDEWCFVSKWATRTPVVLAVRACRYTEYEQSSSIKKSNYS